MGFFLIRRVCSNRHIDPHEWVAEGAAVFSGRVKGFASRGFGKPFDISRSPLGFSGTLAGCLATSRPKHGGKRYADAKRFNH